MKILTILLSAIILVNFVPVVNDYNDSTDEISAFATNIGTSSQQEYAFDVVEDLNYQHTVGKYVINGNYSSYDHSTIKSLVANRDKVYIFYDLDLSDNINANLEILRNHAVIYYYHNGVQNINSYQSNATNSTQRARDISDYVNEKLATISNLTSGSNDEISTMSVDTSLFVTLYSGSNREEGKPYGYIDCAYTVKKYRANTATSLYLLESRVSYVPGKVANNLGGNGYGNQWLNSEGMMKIRAYRASKDVGYLVRYGGVPVYKDAYPVNEPATISISSTYSGNLGLGYSFSNGFSLDNISAESNKNVGLNIGYGYNKVITRQEPALTAQLDPNDAQKFTWVFQYYKPANETNYLTTGYLFEMNNQNHDLFEGDLAFEFEYSMTVSNGSWWIFEAKKQFSGWSYHDYH